MVPYRLVTFDVTNTILQFRNSVGIQYSRIMEKFGVKADPMIVGTLFKRIYKQQTLKHPNFGSRTGLQAKQWWFDVVSKTVKSSTSSSLNGDTVCNISDYLYNFYNSKDAWKVTSDCEMTLNKLKNAGICVGIISNFDDRLPSILRQFNLHQHFSFVLTSYENGFQKPQPDIFHLAEVKSNISDLKRSEIVHIGDNVELDYHAAKQAGWNALLYIGDKTPCSDILPIIQADCAFKSFQELDKYLLK